MGIRSRNNRHRRDAIHKDIVTALISMGCSVRDLSQIGDGGPDLLLGLLGGDFQIEIKSEEGELSEDQMEFEEEWAGGRIHVVRSVLDAIDLVKNLRHCASQADMIMARSKK